MGNKYESNLWIGEAFIDRNTGIHNGKTHAYESFTAIQANTSNPVKVIWTLYRKDLYRPFMEELNQSAGFFLDGIDTRIPMIHIRMKFGSLCIKDHIPNIIIRNYIHPDND